MELTSRNSDGFECLSVSTQGFNPPFEVVETGDSYILVAYVPGFRKEDIRIQITDNAECLKISAEKFLRELIMTTWTWHRLERSVARGFSKAFRIPHNVNTNAITAKFHDHVLYVVMPKLTTTIRCQERLQNSESVEDHSNPLDTSSCPQDQLPANSSTSDGENCSYHPKDLHSEADDAKKDQYASPISYDSSQEKVDSDGEKEVLKNGFDFSRCFCRRTTVLLSIGVASLAIFAAHKLISRPK